MSEVSTPLTPRHFAYVAERTLPEDPFLRELKEAARDAGIPPIWIAPEQASFLQILLKSARASRVVEVGTLAGASAITLARGVPPASEGGSVKTIELDPERAAFARAWIARSEVADRIEVLEGSGDARLAELHERREGITANNFQVTEAASPTSSRGSKAWKRAWH